MNASGNVAVSGSWNSDTYYQKLIVFFIRSDGEALSYAFSSGDTTDASSTRQNHIRGLAVAGGTVWVTGQMPWRDTDQDAFLRRFLPW